MKKFFAFTILLFTLIPVGIAEALDFFDLCRKGTAGEIRSAIFEGVDVNSRDKDGFTPLMRAPLNPNSGVVRVLLDAGADVNARDEGKFVEKGKGMTVLHLAAMGLAHKEVREGRTKMPLGSFRELLDAGADINASSSVGTPLMLTVTFPDADPEFVRLLIECGANVNVRDSEGDTPLGSAD